MSHHLKQNNITGNALVNGRAFSTPGQDNDLHLAEDCATRYKCGWWFKKCHQGILNGLYQRPEEMYPPYDHAISWFSFKSMPIPLRYSVMMITKK